MVQYSCDAKSSADSKKKPAKFTEEMVQESFRELQELRERIAVRFMIKKSKKFDYSKQPVEEKQLSKVAPPSSQAFECLFYLGLTPKNSETEDQKVPKQQNETDLQFRKPVVYECSYCMKFFFHKKLHRRHMINHINKVQLCRWCNQALGSTISKRRHEYMCRQRAV